MKILQVGLGNFGMNHFRAWHELGHGDSLRVAEVAEALHSRATTLRFPADRIATRTEAFWAEADVVDVVTGTDAHYAVCRQALLDGKDVFVEKPMTLSVEEAVDLAGIVAERGRVLQVGYYYRYHPIARWLRGQIAAGALGDLRYAYGSFMGFKRARNDVGVMHTDGIHFIDLFNFLFDATPVDVYGVARDHFKRGLDDLALGLFTYPGDLVARVEAGYIQPGEWRDKVVPGAMTTKSITVVGSRRTVVADFEAERTTMYDVHHELRDGVWTAVQGDVVSPAIPAASPLDQIKAELADFLACVGARRRPAADSVTSGVNLAVIIDAFSQSARERQRLPIAIPRVSAPAPADAGR